MSKRCITAMQLKSFIMIGIWSAICPTMTYADDGLGQAIQITTRFHSFVGRPSWLLIIRDIDHNQNIPYLFDISRGDNFWVAFTYSRHYVIEASVLQISLYDRQGNCYKKYKISNFCHLESRGHIERGTSMYVTITGKLSPNTNLYSCNATSYKDPSFVIVPHTN